jgi:two-component system response regulator
MSSDIRVLQIEDSPDDAELMLRLLKKAGFLVYSERIETAAEMRRLLARQQWDVIVADYRLPNFDAPAALSVLQETGKDIPFIVVSGAIGEDVAVEMMRSGAHDYLLKDRLERLAPAVEREIHAARIRRQHRQAQEDRSAAHSELAAISSNAPVMLLVANAELRVEKLNNMAARLSGRPVHELLGAPLGEVIGCAGAAAGDSVVCGSSQHCMGCVIHKSVASAIQNAVSYESIELWRPVAATGDQRQERCFLVSIAPLALGSARKALICAQDVTAHKQAEQALRETVDRLELALVERAVLFQEVHHRVKNNLQIIASLLSMQARAMPDPDSAGKLMDTEQRVKAMALVHEQLYGQKEISSVDLAAYIRTLAPQLVSTRPGDTSIALRLDLMPTSLSLEQSIPCGLILTEFITNALKYAYPEGNGEIVVRLSSDPSTVELTVADKGVGLPAGFDLKNSTSLGLTIVQALARQIGGSLEIGPPPGCAFTVRIPRESEKSARPAAQRAGQPSSAERGQNPGRVAVW